jgi:hypothetical protein
VIFNHDIRNEENSTLGRHFMASLLWNTEPEKMVEILKVMINAYKKYGLPINYNGLGIEEE